ncbi:DUF975 domain-containing protein [Lyngbya confervoides]|uniref:DUF7847 domain-containing protein n=1 Tax=Lyngbya confervoides BDU141951 TaxID=1574623 RepID=A0ABD4T7K9_9CYAN|nr:DUF975 domain-containing protein [Lyngbya confervoides]MCM1984562.1 hypothetical protein [Lyngbya confervoides BDU141951]
MFNSNPSRPFQPLSVGDVVSAGVRLYRTHLTQYLRLSAIAYLWIFVPVYGWAKYSEITGRIARLAFGDVIQQPESEAEVMRHTQPQLWNFLAAGLLVGCIAFGIYIVVIIALLILVGLALVLGSVSPGLARVILPIFAVVGFIALLILIIRLFSRLLIVEVPLAIEPNLDAVSAISRSWKLTQGAVGRIQWIVVVTFLITLVVNIPTQVLSALLPTEDVNPGVALLSTFLLLGVSFGGAILVMPLWQAIKAVVYYDLRARREGFGLGLRNPAGPIDPIDP